MVHASPAHLEERQFGRQLFSLINRNIRCRLRGTQRKAFLPGYHPIHVLWTRRRDGLARARRGQDWPYHAWGNQPVAVPYRYVQSLLLRPFYVLIITVPDQVRSVAIIAFLSVVTSAMVLTLSKVPKGRSNCASNVCSQFMFYSLSVAAGSPRESSKPQAPWNLGSMSDQIYSACKASSVRRVDEPYPDVIRLEPQ